MPPSMVFTIVPAAPTANPVAELIKLTPIRSLRAGSPFGCGKKVVPPSVVARIMPFVPTTQPRLASMKETPVSCSLVPDLREANVAPPSCVATMVPSSPTAHAWSGPTVATPRSCTSVPALRSSQCSPPLAVVAILPKPTTIPWEASPKAMLDQGPGGEICSSQVPAITKPKQCARSGARAMTPSCIEGARPRPPAGNQSPHRRLNFTGVCLRIPQDGVIQRPNVGIFARQRGGWRGNAVGGQVAYAGQ